MKKLFIISKTNEFESKYKSKLLSLQSESSLKYLGTPMKQLRLLFLFLFVLSSAPGYGQSSADRDSTAAVLVSDSMQQILSVLESQAFASIKAGDYDAAKIYGEKLLDEAYQIKDYHGYVISAHICLGLATAKKGEIELAMGHLGQAHTNAASGNNNSVVEEAFRELFALAQDEHDKRLQEQTNMLLTGVILLALLIIIALLIHMYVRKNQLYEAIVRQNHSILEREEQNHQKTATTVDDAKKGALVARLEKLMQEEHLYRENLLTRDRVAEILDTNRTYLGQIMSEVYQKSFTQYINDLRIDEAIRILDNPKSVRPIRLIGVDLGFNSVTTFNTQFQNRTGMTPAQYRKKVIDISKGNAESNSEE